MTTKRHPRTLQEAFGPYTSDYINEEKESDWTWAAVSFVATLALLLIVL